LIPQLGAQGAADLHDHLASQTIAWARQFAAEQAIDLEVHFDGGSEQSMAARYGSDPEYVQQAQGDLGLRLTAATETTTGPTLIIGSDCPDLDSRIAERALRALECADIVLGPATDGGYYLIGIKRPLPELFAGIPWGTDQVARITQEIAANRGLSVAMLDVLADIDRPEDLATLDDRAIADRAGTITSCGMSRGDDASA
jgi:rSAM/selenodomain-associated transferase 1